MINIDTYMSMVDSLLEDNNTIGNNFKYCINILYDLFSKKINSTFGTPKIKINYHSITLLIICSYSETFFVNKTNQWLLQYLHTKHSSHRPLQYVAGDSNALNCIHFFFFLECDSYVPL